MSHFYLSDIDEYTKEDMLDHMNWCRHRRPNWPIGHYTNHCRVIEIRIKSHFVIMLDVILKDPLFAPNDPVITMITLDV